MEIAYLAIRWQSWQTWFKTEKLTNIPPPAVGGSGDADPDEIVFAMRGVWVKPLSGGEKIYNEYNFKEYQNMKNTKI